MLQLFLKEMVITNSFEGELQLFFWENLNCSCFFAGMGIIAQLFLEGTEATKSFCSCRNQNYYIFGECEILL